MDDFVSSSTRTHKLLMEAGKQQSETYTALKQEVATQWNSSYAMLENILKNQKILLCVFLNDSFEENNQCLLPTASEFRSNCLLCSLLAPFADATKLLEGETYITGSFGQAVLRQLRSELLTDALETWRDGSAVKKLRLAEVSGQFDSSATCHFSLLVLAFQSVVHGHSVQFSLDSGAFC